MKQVCSKCCEIFDRGARGDYKQLTLTTNWGKAPIMSRIDHIYILCPKCSANFNKWINYTPKKKGEK